MLTPLPSEGPVLESVAPPLLPVLRSPWRTAWRQAAAFIAVLWVVQILVVVLRVDPGDWGVVPRVPTYLWGILTAPLVHGSWSHLVSNTAPRAFLMVAGGVFHPRALRAALPFIWVGSGALVWLMGRESSHIGASGIVYGLMAWVVALGVIRRTRDGLMLMLVALFLYGSLIWGVLPLDPHVSFESHIAGALMGIAAAILGSHIDPMPLPPPVDPEEGDAGLV